jgi:hypothetical protein
MRRRPTLLALLLFSATLVQAQFYKTILPTSEFKNSLEKIILDFRSNYKNIQGEQLMKEGNIETFESVIKLPGAYACRIFQYNSVVDTSATWQAIMYRGDDYNEAVRSYENIFRLVKKSHVKWIDRSSIGFEGEMKKPKEEMRFTVSTLKFKIDDPRYEKFIAEIEMIPSQEGWEVRFNLVTKKPDTEGNLY